jgi:hypothetical protein
MYPIKIQIVQCKKGGNLVMFSKKISRRSFLKVSAVTTAMAAMGLPAFAAEDTAEENCFQTLNIPRATGSTVDKSVLLDESRLYLITDFGAVSEGDPVQNTKAINAAIQAASEAGGVTLRATPSVSRAASTFASTPTASSGLPGQTCTTGMATRPWWARAETTMSRK